LLLLLAKSMRCVVNLLIYKGIEIVTIQFFFFLRVPVQKYRFLEQSIIIPYDPLSAMVIVHRFLAFFRAMARTCYNARL
jgi:hypothetical protein